MTVLQRIELADLIALSVGRAADRLRVRRRHDRDGALHGAGGSGAGVEPHWTVEIEKAIPVAAGLGGGSSDAAAALRLANELLPVAARARSGSRELAATIGADVPFFLGAGRSSVPATGPFSRRVDLPQDFWVVLRPPDGRAQGVDR